MELNLIEILIATLIGMLLGAAWYSSLLFGNTWMQCIGKTPETLGSSTTPMIGSILASFLTALGVSLIFSLIGVSTLTMALAIGAIFGLLIIFPAMLSDSLFCGWGNKLLLVQAGYRIVSIILMSVAIFYV